MKVYVYPGDQWGCGAYRLAWPGRAVDGTHDVTVIAPGSRDVRIDIDHRGRPARETFPADADVIVFQRPTNGYMSQVIPLLRARGVAVVVDMDDDLSAIHPRNPAFAALQPTIPGPGGRRRRNLHSWHNAAQACRDATLVTVTTPALAERYGAHGRVRVIPNYVPRWYLDVEHDDSDLIGWGGVVGTHPDDLQVVGPSIAKLIRTAGARFETVGDPAGVGRALGIGDDPPSPGPVVLDEWPRAIARFGIGIAPLAFTRFNSAKSRLKPLEYAAVGVPWVGSPLPDYAGFHRLGTGLIATRPKDWERLLRQLLRDPSRRAELSEAGRTVASEHTIEGNAWRWAEAWADAAELQRHPAAIAV